MNFLVKPLDQGQLETLEPAFLAGIVNPGEDVRPNLNLRVEKRSLFFDFSCHKVQYASRAFVSPNALATGSPSENRGLVPIRLPFLQKRREPFRRINADSGQGHHLFGIVVGLPFRHFDLSIEDLLGHGDRILA